MSTLRALRTIVRNDGVYSLWDGLRPTLVMAVPNTMLYMVLYDELAHSVLPERFGWSVDTSAIVAGGASRAFSGMVVAPLELVRTQMQADAGVAQRGMMHRLRANVVSNGFLSLWRGLMPTLWRDVPFSIAYWYGYEMLRANMLQRRMLGSLVDGGTGAEAGVAVGGHSPEGVPKWDMFAVSFASGAGAGMLAAFVTTPFDVVKTQRQVDVSAVEGKAGKRQARQQLHAYREAGTMRVMANIVRAEGVGGLFTGVVPRVVKVAPACAIMISSYEMGKALFND